MDVIKKSEDTRHMSYICMISKDNLHVNDADTDRNPTSTQLHPTAHMLTTVVIIQNNVREPEQFSRYSDWLSEFESRGSKNFLFSSTSSRPALGSTQLSIQRVSGRGV
jgi:hypothetical protein